MTRKDYILIAAALKAAQTIPQAARNLADQLAQDNLRFDRTRFLEACGVQS